MFLLKNLEQQRKKLGIKKYFKMAQETKSTGIMVAVVLAVVLILCAIYFFYLKPKRKAKKINNAGNENSSTTTTKGNGASSIQVNTNNTGLTNTTFPLKQGSKGTEVLYLQAALNYFKGKTLALDGDFGPLTEAALYSVSGVKAAPEYYYNQLVKPYMSQLKLYMQNKGIAI